MPLQIGLVRHQDGAARKEHLVLLQILQHPLGGLERGPIHDRVDNHKQIDVVGGAEGLRLGRRRAEREGDERAMAIWRW